MVVKFNGVPVTVCQNTTYNDYWKNICVYFYIDVDTSKRAFEVVVSSEGENISVGGTAQFTADVFSYGENSNGVSWSVTGNTSNSTTINSEGLLSVAEDENAETLTIRATSTCTNSVYGECEINVLQEPLSINNIRFTSTYRDAYKGENLTFTAHAYGTAPLTVDWSLFNAQSSNTRIEILESDSDWCELYVGEDETASQITLRAFSTFDNSKYVEQVIEVKDNIKITEVNVVFDIDAYPLSSKYTYSEWKNIFYDNCEPKSFENGYRIDTANSGLYYYDDQGAHQTYAVANEPVFEDLQHVLYVYYEPDRGYYFDGNDISGIVVKMNGRDVTKYTETDYNQYWKCITVSFFVDNSMGISTPGDLNNDTAINIIDVKLLLTKVIGHTSGSWSEAELATGDMNNDGDINIIDVKLLLQTVISSIGS